MSNLAEKLRNASFRGVPFFVEQADRTAGRRTQTHEYPQRDDPYIEDLGRARREFNLTAFVVGADYIAAADKLLEACEMAGSGTLVHPWLGSMEVTLQTPARASYSKALGQATIDMSFVEAGKLNFPAAVASTQKQVVLSADKLANAAATDFSILYKINGLPDFVQNAANGDFTRVFSSLALPKIPGLGVLGFANSALKSLESTLLLLNDPPNLAWSVLNFMGLSSVARQLTYGASLIDSILSLTASNAFAAPLVTRSGAIAGQQQQTNTEAINALTRRGLLVQAIGLSSLVPAVVHNDTIALRNTLTSAMEAEMMTASDSVYQALSEARAAVWADLTARAKNAARLANLMPPEVMPMLVVAYDYYADATRDAEIIQRNNVRHPLFVPVVPLKVLAA